MFADFRGATRGTGKSFKGALDYFLNDKGLGDERPTTDERVDVLELRNLATDNPRHAWFEMMSTAQASDALKEAAGIKKGGRAGEKPVFTYHLAWHDSERPDRAAMLDAARSTLQLLGLENHQALIVAHTDTAHPHVHVIVNRVNPEDGRYAGLSNSWKALKGWAIEYSKAHGTAWHIPLEQAKEAREQRRQTERQAGFNRTAGGKAPQEAKTAARGNAQGRAEWQGRKDAGRGNNPAEVAAAASLKAELAAKWSALRQFQRETAEKQWAEKSRLSEDRKAGRAAIYEKYNEANKAIWTVERPGSAVGARPSSLAEKTRQALSSRRREFEEQERSLIGRLSNASRLARGQSLFAVVQLALNSGERRRLFDLEQRRTATQGRQGVEQKVKAAWVPETRRMQSDRLKVMRAAELAAFDRGTGKLRQDLIERHQIQTEGLAAMKAALSASGKAAWATHAAVFRGPQVREARPAQEQATERTQRPQEAARDRFGRSRDRKPREPRSERRGDLPHSGPEAASAAFNQAADTQQAVPQSALAKAESSRVFTEAGTHPRQSGPDRTEADHTDKESWSPAELKALAQERARATEREANEGREDRGPGRER